MSFKNEVEKYYHYYSHNEQYKTYVDKFARDNHILPAQAIMYQSCINYLEYLLEGEE